MCPLLCPIGFRNRLCNSAAARKRGHFLKTPAPRCRIVPPENYIRQRVAESARLNQLAARESLANEICRCTRERETVRAQAQRPKKMQRAARWTRDLQAARPSVQTFRDFREAQFTNGFGIVGASRTSLFESKFTYDCQQNSPLSGATRDSSDDALAQISITCSLLRNGWNSCRYRAGRRVHRVHRRDGRLYGYRAFTARSNRSCAWRTH